MRSHFWSWFGIWTSWFGTCSRTSRRLKLYSSCLAFELEVVCQVHILGGLKLIRTRPKISLDRSSFDKAHIIWSISGLFDAFGAIWRFHASRMSWNEVLVVSSSSVCFSFFEWSSDILRKMDFLSVWQVNKGVLIDTSSAFKVKIEDFWSFLMENSICGLKNARVGHILKLLEIFLTEWNPFALLIEPNDLAPWSYIPPCRVDSELVSNFRNLNL